MRNMLVFDSAYSYADLKSRELEDFILARDQGNFFSKIVTFHPFAGVQYANDLAVQELYGSPAIYELDERNIFIEGKRGRFARLAKFERLNYALSFGSILLKVFQAQRKYHFRVIRAEDALLNGMIAWFISTLLRAPLIVGVWGNSNAIRRQTGKTLMPRIFRSTQFEERWEKFVLNRAKMILVGNQDNANAITIQGIPEDRVQILPVAFNLNPVHMTKPEDRENLRQELNAFGIGNAILITCISRLEPVKLVDHVLRAAPFIRPQDWDYRILLVGEGSQLEDLRLLGRDLGIEDKVIFCGNRDQEWISRLVVTSDVVASPLTGRALAEAAMGAAAIVAYDIDWQGELIQTSKTGELVPFLDYKAMGASISHFLEDPAYAKKMGKAARKAILNKMANIDIASKMNSIYVSL